LLLASDVAVAEPAVTVALVVPALPEIVVSADPPIAPQRVEFAMFPVTDARLLGWFMSMPLAVPVAPAVIQNALSETTHCEAKFV